MPRGLFLKIFLWFGTIVLTFICITFIAGEVSRPHRHEPPSRRTLDPLLALNAKQAAEEYERGSQHALVAHLERLEHQTHFRLFLFNRELQELSGRRIPSDAPELARRIFQTRLPESLDREQSPMVGHLAQTESGNEYVLIADLPARPTRLLFHPLLHLIFIVLTGGIFCYWLARHLTSPIAKLRAATREIAEGNLNARVVPAVGNRHDELASLAADFDEMAEKIESLINSQRRLLGDISHELRSPLARLNVALELARQRSGPEALTALERIQREAELLNEMIGQLLALTRMESGAQEFVKSEVDLNDLVQAIATDADFEARARNRSVRLIARSAVKVSGVQHLLRAAIENVVRNAVHHTNEGTEVEITLTADDAVSIVVRDHGPGVPEDALNKIFRPFYRVDEARDREAGGVGLGLAIAERAIRLHGGQIEARNAPDGLIVTIKLPR